MHPAFSPLPIPYDKTFHATTAEQIAASTKKKIHGGPEYRNRKTPCSSRPLCDESERGVQLR
jgi:hypothetical protein